MKKILLAIIILIFLLFSSYSISNYMFDKKYNKASILTDDIEILKIQFINDTEIYDQLNDIQETILFINSVCLNQGEQ